VIGVVHATAAGRLAAERLAAAWGDDVRLYGGKAAVALPAAFAECRAVVAFLATGAAVRLLAPHLRGKAHDPGVVCVDEAGRYAVALLGGHAGGADDLARRVGAVLGCEPVVTTATDAAGISGLDTLGWPAEGEVAAVSRAILDGEPVRFVSDRVWPLPAFPPNVSADAQSRYAIIVSDREGVGQRSPEGVVILRPPSLVVGVGASRGVPEREVLDLIDTAFAAGGLSAGSIRCLATADVKSSERGIVAAARTLGVPLVVHGVDALAQVKTPNPSSVVERAVGAPSVAEAAALIGAQAGDPPRGELVVSKRTSAMATVAVARHRPRGRLALVGIGPGARDLLTPRAADELRRVSVVVGLDSYVAQVRGLLRPGTRVLASGLGHEQERAQSAVAEARRGRAVALISSGDAGVYGMASPALDCLTDGPEGIDVVGVPGITAATAAAAALGAPLGHDHVAISLSDLHTPWEVIERRVAAAADGDLVVCFYNPRSHGRDWQLTRALAVLASRRPPTTPVGYVRDASRPDEQVTVTTLAEVDVAAVDMHTIVIVGSSTTRLVGGRMVTPRGYAWRP
jgi:cobalt-precorrin 5A hydrolase/precorrin-3B C17-methyltransferase